MEQVHIFLIHHSLIIIKIKNNTFNDNTIKYIKKLINGKAGIIYNLFNYDKYIWKEDTKNKLILI